MAIIKNEKRVLKFEQRKIWLLRQRDIQLAFKAVSTNDQMIDYSFSFINTDEMYDKQDILYIMQEDILEVATKAGQ